MTSILPKKYLAKGFKVFVTIPGVVTSKVSFLADPTFQGEHNFFIHGIHVVKVGYLYIFVNFLLSKSYFDFFHRAQMNSKIGITS